MSDVDNTNEDSSIEQQGQEAAPDASEIIKNTKAEFARKTSNLEAKLAETNAQLEAMVRMVTEANKPKGPAKPAKDLLFEDPDAFIADVESRATARAQESVSKQREADQAMQAAIGEMSAKFPEFAMPGSEAAQMAIEMANKLPARLKGTAEGVELVMSKAAAELGLIPVSRRQKKAAAQSSDEDFVAGARSSGSETRKQSAGSKKVDEKTLAFAQLLGVDINDKKRLESLSKASERQNWKTYK